MLSYSALAMNASGKVQFDKKECGHVFETTQITNWHNYSNLLPHILFRDVVKEPTDAYRM